MTGADKAGRAEILAKVRAGLGQSGAATSPDRRVAVERRLAARTRHLIPARVAGKSGPELVAILRQWLEAEPGGFCRRGAGHRIWPTLEPIIRWSMIC